jgi:SagB-type dehydrogenase family enzyme
MRDRAVAGLACVVLAVVALGCVEEAPDSITAETQRFDEITDLPAPDTTGEISLEQTLLERRSAREFAPVELTRDIIGQLFWAGQGITDEQGHRTAPSAGGLYPLELYAVTTTEVMHYVPDGHRVESRSDTTSLSRLGDLAFGQDFLGSAPAVLVVVGVDARTAAEYGAMAADFVEREAGHATQNILLQATALGLAAVPVGGFDPARTARLLALPPGHDVLYLVPVGEPAELISGSRGGP